MARPLRIEIAGGWYHITARGNQRQPIFADDGDRQHLLELLEEFSKRFEVRLHAFVEMTNHYHLLAETPVANLSQAMHWLQLSYSSWYNHRHRRSGHFFQGRYQAILVEAEGVAYGVSQYLHLNPVRVRALGLDKGAQHRSRQDLGAAPTAEQIQQRLKRLRSYPWSSYRTYIGLVEPPGWLTTQTLLALGGGRSWAERRRGYRQETEQAVREGLESSPWERLQEQVLLGGVEFVRRMKACLSGDEREQPSLRGLRDRPGWEAVVKAVERERGERWEGFRDRYGDWGRDLVLYVARRRCGLRLRELAALSGGIDYGSVAVAISRFGKRLQRDKQLRQITGRIANELYK